MACFLFYLYGLVQGFLDGVTERFSGDHEQRPSLGKLAVILHNPSVAMCWESFEGVTAYEKFENHWFSGS